MNRKQVKKIKKMMYQYGKGLVFAAVLLAVGCGALIARAIAADVMTISSSLTSKNVTMNGSSQKIYRLTDTEATNRFTATISNVSGTITNNDFTWTTSHSDLIAVNRLTSSSTFGATVEAKKAGYAPFHVKFSYTNNGTVTAEEKDVYAYVPLQATFHTNTGAVVSDTNAYEQGTTIRVDANTCATNKLQIKAFNYATNGTFTEATVNSDYKVSYSTDGTSATVEFLTAGYFKLRAYTADCDDSGSNASLLAEELCDEQYLVIGNKFLMDTATGNYRQVHKSTAGNLYCILPDTTDSYPVMTNANTNVAPSARRITWQSGKTEVVTTAENTSNKYMMMKGEYAGIAPVEAGVIQGNISGSTSLVPYSNSDRICYAIVPYKWAMDGIDTDADGKASKAINMNVNDSYTLSTTGNPNYVTWSVSPSSNCSVSDGVFQASAIGQYTVHATLAASQFVSTDTQLVDFMGKQTISIVINVIDSFGLRMNSNSITTNENFDLTAVATDTSQDVTFTVTKLPIVAGDPTTIPISDIVQLTDIKSPTTGKIVGVNVAGKSVGSVRITASQTINGVTKTAECYVYVSLGVTEVTIDPSTVTLEKGTVQELTVRFNGSNTWPANDNVQWLSSDTSIVKVTPDANKHTAQITGMKGGTASITLITEEGLHMATCTVHVTEPVTSITLSETNVTASLLLQNYQLTATVLPAGEGVNHNVTWESSDPSVLTVNNNGLVTFKKSGTAVVTAYADDNYLYHASCTFVINIPVQSLTLDEDDIILSINEQKRLTAHITPNNPTQPTLKWTSSKSDVCMVDDNGLLTAVGPGNCTILVETTDGSALSAMCNVYVKQPVTSVELNTYEITVRKGTVFWLNATCLPENADNKICEWTSTDTDVCTVEQDGKVTATGSGICNIVCTNVDTGIADFCVVTVTQPITGFSLNSTYQSMWVGAKYAIIPHVEPIDADNKNVTYQSSDTAVATVDENGVVTAVAGGKCVIVATTEELGLKASVTIEVHEYVSSLELSDYELYMNYNTMNRIFAYVGAETATNKNVIWTSADPSIVTVNDGYLAALNYGTVIITAVAADGSGCSDSCIVRVVKPVTSITIEPSEVRLQTGDRQKVRAVINPTDATIHNVTWSSSDESIATIDDDGEITAIGVGKCTVTATSADGNEIHGSCAVYVTPVVHISSMRVTSSEITMLTGKTRKLGYIATPQNHTESVNWYSTDTSVVVVDGEGNITTVGPGNAEVVAFGGVSNVSGSCIVHALGLTQTSLSIGQYDTFDLEVIGAGNMAASWHTGNPRVATVDANGHIVARMRGTTTITATVDNKTLSCVVTVKGLY